MSSVQILKRILKKCLMENMAKKIIILMTSLQILKRILNKSLMENIAKKILKSKGIFNAKSALQFLELSGQRKKNTKM